MAILITLIVFVKGSVFGENSNLKLNTVEILNSDFRTEYMSWFNEIETNDLSLKHFAYIPKSKWQYETDLKFVTVLSNTT